MNNSMRYFELEDEDLSDILDMADDETAGTPRYERIIPAEGGARERFVRETAKHLSALRPGARMTVLDWGRMLDVALANIYIDPASGRVMTQGDIH